ncbi:aminotransferase class I/II-fold pyridoxal phosphate-dependent enzyme [Euzebyella marina]|uniref:Aminotransferase class I/II-fold pyridoxal phosphate-dependent enzyme n=1 Tax=Euzebyella marina TaxID=1761453 RepID=A0A3G2L5I4_9FLAO|nr:aminotransferase class I/II-fold pyridoxal phosphate-dependent enzyme [Euzebyella marina]AYN67535.1 aminotransferase class I/II-fold pyridoxal phosphate-dependent enzyme [Euzebyella marina]
MAKIRHNNFLDTVHDLMTNASREGVLHLYAEGDHFTGRHISVKGKSLMHFGTTGYLGLEQDERLKSAAMAAIDNYGTQFPLSKSYISHPLYEQLEFHLNQMYGYPIVVTKNSTLGHLGVIPSIVGTNDAIILDHQVHWSVQSACRLLKSQGVALDMIRHNHLQMLEDRIKFHIKRRKIWYMADGIYSMFGDYAPVVQLMELAKKYPQLHLYFDDVHGMSWIGKNGTGYVLDQLKELSDQVLVFGTLSKTFGASGAVLICPNEKLYQKIKTFGGPLTFSAQLEPSAVGAAIASSKIHLSKEIYQLQEELSTRIQYFNDLLKLREVVIIDDNNSPVFYVGTGAPETGYKLVRRLMDDGFYTNLGMFPAVPVKNTGIRITISRHNQLDDIKALAEALEHHYPKVLQETVTSTDRIKRAFGIHSSSNPSFKNDSKLLVKVYQTIEKVDKELWDSNLGRNGLFNWDGLLWLEKNFKNNSAIENNWQFQYIIIQDSEGIPVLLTFMTISLWKDDMLSPENVSQELEAKRKGNPYYMTSKVLSMGSLFTEGKHIFLNEKHPLYKKALHLFILAIEKMEGDTGAQMVVFRDFSKENRLQSFLFNQGYMKIRMPDTCSLPLPLGITAESHIAQLSPRNRRHFRKEILPYEAEFQIEILQNVNSEEREHLYKLYLNVQKNNLGLNTFPLPISMLDQMASNPNWEFIILRLKSESGMPLIGVMFCYINTLGNYIPAFVGMDYRYITSYHLYRQLLYQTIKRAMALNLDKIDFGMTASFEKRKLGAQVHEVYAFLQTRDNYKLEFLGLMEGQNKS